ncbi:MAG: hypothetical protein ACJ786_11965 [Catenulispora sp.]|jgi:hypothetical protein
MAGPNLHPDASANEALGDEHGGNTDQPEDGRDEQGRLPAPQDAADYEPSGINVFADPAQMRSAGKSENIVAETPEDKPEGEPAPGGMNSENAGALTGAKARKSPGKSTP